MPNRVEIFRAVANRVALDRAEREVRGCTRAVFNRANVLTPVDTGNLRAGNQMLPVRRAATKVTSGVTNRVKYAGAVHDGARPHIIRARRKKALRFRMGGHVVIVKSVRHPGNRARPWLTRALREVAPARGFRVDT